MKHIKNRIKDKLRDIKYHIWLYEPHYAMAGFMVSLIGMMILIKLFGE